MRRLRTNTEDQNRADTERDTLKNTKRALRQSEMVRLQKNLRIYFQVLNCNVARFVACPQKFADEEGLRLRHSVWIWTIFSK